jgi:hypothetical protein
MNLDAMTENDLMKLWHDIHVHPVKMARQLFPKQAAGKVKGYVSAAETLGAYASNKATAMACRKRGDIQAALIYEKTCDMIYDDLPVYARW